MTASAAGPTVLPALMPRGNVGSAQWDTALAEALEWSQLQPGFNSSEMFCVPDTETYIDVNYVASKGESEVHMDKVVNTPENEAIFAAIDESSVRTFFGRQIPLTIESAMEGAGHA